MQSPLTTVFAGSEEDVPKFNKYSGVAEWNNAVFLWVNVDGNTYGNSFYSEGRYITWFGGNRMAAGILHGKTPRLGVRSYNIFVHRISYS